MTKPQFQACLAAIIEMLQDKKALCSIDNPFRPTQPTPAKHRVEEGPEAAAGGEVGRDRGGGDRGAAAGAQVFLLYSDYWYKRTSTDTQKETEAPQQVPNSSCFTQITGTNVQILTRRRRPRRRSSRQRSSSASICASVPVKQANC
jgi:hypothetical protein